MVDIEIKFPKSPKTPPRRRVQTIGAKYSYIEDDYFSIIRISEINNDLLTILESIRSWKDNECYVDGELIDTRYLLNLVECVLRKEKPNSLEWYYDGYDYRALIMSYKTFEDLKEALDQENNPRDVGRCVRERDFNISWSLRHLIDSGMIKVVTPNVEWKIEVDDIIEDIKTRSNVIRKLYPDFDTTDIFNVIRSFPDKIVIDVKEEDVEEDEDVGEEWVDWCDDVKYKKTVIDLLTKIEENTRKTQN